MNKEDVMKWSRSLTERQFAEFFYEVVAGRNTSDVFEGHFVLADAERIKGEPWEIDFVGLPNPNHAANLEKDWVDDADICESGTCQHCQIRVRSWVKDALCPVCGSEVYCS